MASQQPRKARHRGNTEGPDRHFRAPRDVVADGRFTTEEKRRILDSWALDAQLLTVAEEENMGGQDRPGLRDVKLALARTRRECA